MNKKVVIIPTYNEIENIEEIIRVVFALENDFDILVVDDNSPDQTFKKVQELQTDFPDRLYLVIRDKKLGLGKAYVHGFKWALSHNYDYILQMDADFSHNPSDLQKLYIACKKQNIDMSIGSRYLTGVNVVNWPLFRVLLSYFASIYVRLILNLKIHDTTAGFVCYKRKVLEKINVNSIIFVGYTFQIEMKYRAFAKGFRLVEIPIIFKDRIRGKSKMSAGIIREAIFGVIFLRLKKMFGNL